MKTHRLRSSRRCAPWRQAPWHSARTLLCALALALPSSPGAAAATPCLASLLEALGWRIEAGAGPQARILGGAPCARPDLDAARAAGDLRIELPAGARPEQRDAALRAALADPATTCAWGFRLADATRRASGRLQDNPGYRFSALQLGWIGFGPGGAQRQGWERTRAFGRGYRPAGSNSTAIAAFYDGRVRSECGVGRQVAQLATQLELYGADGFDREFTADELSIGTFLALHDTDSILLGAQAGDLVADGKARQAARRGRQAFVGLPGFIVHVFDRDHLDDVNNQAQNFVVAGVSADAAEALRRHGGFAHYDAVSREIWSLAQDLDPPGLRGFQRLLHERHPDSRARLGARSRDIVARIDALLDDPFYREFELYVHPMGVKPVGFHIVRLLDRNPRTPFAMELALHNVHTTLFRRWIAHRLRACGLEAEQARALARDAVPEAGSAVPRDASRPVARRSPAAAAVQ